MQKCVVGILNHSTKRAPTTAAPPDNNRVQVKGVETTTTPASFSAIVVSAWTEDTPDIEEIKLIDVAVARFAGDPDIVP